MKLDIATAIGAIVLVIGMAFGLSILLAFPVK